MLKSDEGEEEEVVQGLTSHMEMCDFFLFFWTDITGLSLAQVGGSHFFTEGGGVIFIEVGGSHLFTEGGRAIFTEGRGVIFT